MEGYTIQSGTRQGGRSFFILSFATSGSHSKNPCIPLCHFPEKNRSFQNLYSILTDFRYLCLNHSLQRDAVYISILVSAREKTHWFSHTVTVWQQTEISVHDNQFLKIELFYVVSTEGSSNPQPSNQRRFPACRYSLKGQFLCLCSESSPFSKAVGMHPAYQSLFSLGLFLQPLCSGMFLLKKKNPPFDLTFLSLLLYSALLEAS